MTTNDIKSVRILVETKDGQVLVGATTDAILIRMIAYYVKFVKVDEQKLSSVCMPIYT